MSLKFDTNEIINAYEKGESLNAIAHTFNSYPTTIKRILERNNIKLRHDVSTKGSYNVSGGEKLIEWAKAQDRLVTKTELAKVIGRKKLSPSYFEKYPELGQYIKSREQKDLQKYTQQLYDWLKINNILYKPNDKTRLKMSVTALLLGDYSNIAIQLNIKPKNLSEKQHKNRMLKTIDKAAETGTVVICIDENYFKDLSILKDNLDLYKRS